MPRSLQAKENSPSRRRRRNVTYQTRRKILRKLLLPLLLLLLSTEKPHRISNFALSEFLNGAVKYNVDNARILWRFRIVVKQEESRRERSFEIANLERGWLTDVES